MKKIIYRISTNQVKAISKIRKWRPSGGVSNSVCEIHMVPNHRRSDRLRRSKRNSQNAACGVLLLLLATDLKCKSRHIWRPTVRWDMLAWRMESEGIFRRCFRMDRSSFENLTVILQPLLINPRQKRKRGIKTPHEQLAMTLRFLAGGSYLDLVIIYGVSKNTFFQIVHRVANAICSSSVGGFYLPENTAQFRALAEGFQHRSSHGIIQHCIGAVDGLLVRVRAPVPVETPNVKRFRSGNKKSFGLNLQCICDSDLYIYAASCCTPGSTNDLVAWDHCYFSQFATKIPEPYFLIGDAAYELQRTLLTPIATGGPQAHGFKESDAYNFYLSQLRITVERAFGVLVARWGIFWRPMRMKLRFIPTIVRACIQLHNFCILRQQPSISLTEEWDRRRGFPKDRPLMSENGVLLPPSQWTTLFAPAAQSDVTGTNKRDEVRSLIAAAGMVRPSSNIIRNADTYNDELYQ
jgi:hypothetical protein